MRDEFSQMLSQVCAEECHDWHEQDEDDVDVAARLANGHHLHDVVALGHVGERVDAALLDAEIRVVGVGRGGLRLRLGGLQNDEVLRPANQDEVAEMAEWSGWMPHKLMIVGSIPGATSSHRTFYY